MCKFTLRKFNYGLMASLVGIILGGIIAIINIPPILIVNKNLNPTVATVYDHITTSFTLNYVCNCDFTGQYCQYCNQSQYNHAVTLSFLYQYRELKLAQLALGNDTYPEILDPSWKVDTTVEVLYNYCYYDRTKLCYYTNGFDPIYLSYIPLPPPIYFILGLVLMSLSSISIWIFILN